MADSHLETKVDNEIVRMWRTDGRLYAISGFLLGLMVFPLLASLDGGRLAAFLQELAPEGVGILVTVIVIDRMNRRRDERNAEAALKRQLVDDAASISNEIAKNAIHQLRRRGWLSGEKGLLRHAYLWGANLQGADLREANLQRAELIRATLQEANLYAATLQGVELTGANLQGAQLNGANLQGAGLLGANLQGAALRWANLQEAELTRASLQGAQLNGANLQGAGLSLAYLKGAGFLEADLQGADLSHAEFDETTLLPDGTQWTAETDMSRFTNPTHPDFWRSDSEYSPAYRGKSADV